MLVNVAATITVNTNDVDGPFAKTLEKIALGTSTSPLEWESVNHWFGSWVSTIGVATVSPTVVITPLSNDGVEVRTGKDTNWACLHRATDH